MISAMSKDGIHLTVSYLADRYGYEYLNAMSDVAEHLAWRLAIGLCLKTGGISEDDAKNKLKEILQ